MGLGAYCWLPKVTPGGMIWVQRSWFTCLSLKICVSTPCSGRLRELREGPQRREWELRTPLKAIRPKLYLQAGFSPSGLDIPMSFPTLPHGIRHLRSPVSLLTSGLDIPPFPVPMCAFWPGRDRVSLYIPLRIPFYARDFSINQPRFTQLVYWGTCLWIPPRARSVLWDTSCPWHMIKW